MEKCVGAIEQPQALAPEQLLDEYIALTHLSLPDRDVHAIHSAERRIRETCPTEVCEAALARLANLEDPNEAGIPQTELQMRQELSWTYLNICEMFATHHNLPRLWDIYTRSSDGVAVIELTKVIAQIVNAGDIAMLRDYVAVPDTILHDRYRCLRRFLEIAVAAIQRSVDNEEQLAWQSLIDDFVTEYNARDDIKWELDTDDIQGWHKDGDPVGWSYNTALDMLRADSPDYQYAGGKEDGRIPSAPARAETIRNILLMSRGSNSVDERHLYTVELNEKRPPLWGITLGIETEVPMKNLEAVYADPRSFRTNDWTRAMYDHIKAYHMTQKYGVPHSYERDMVWEFSHNPVRYYNTVIIELMALMRAGLIPIGAQLPLHITLGGLREQSRGNVELLTRALEATAWGTSAERVTQSSREPHNHWLNKGTNGVKFRDADGLKGGAESAAELRVFEVNNISGATRLLRSAYALGSAALAKQQVTSGNAPYSYGQEALAKCWDFFSVSARALFVRYGMDDPVACRWYSSYNREATPTTRLDNNFMRHAELLGKTVSPFRDRMHELVIEARAKAMLLIRA